MTRSTPRLAIAALALAAVLPSMAAAADDFSLSYDVDRFPSSRLDLQACRAAVARGAAAIGYTTRIDRDQKTLAIHVAGPRQDGRALVAYCITAGDQTVFVVQGLDYSGRGSPEAERVKNAVAAELRKAARAD
ncbi:DUF6180 family protein [Pseudoxanthomonas sp.]|uniref:DUF6180 family protein n=1 Tax=Pseudoxanthomonas sp. TaxID=1871049 RepID=UPI0025878198|nr:DUF6180 family protein [Pseudoxanthomonas sp.]MCR6685551.1 DUF6180 family protein [Pseudoxanthomonas sp.]